jgi:hypothetical protein
MGASAEQYPGTCRNHEPIDHALFSDQKDSKPQLINLGAAEAV